MPSNPDNTRMDEALKVLARKRRDDAGAPFDLHPATRKLLQGEVTRVYPRPGTQRKSWLQLVTMFWPRLAFATALFAVLGVVCWTSFSSLRSASKPTRLARNEDVAPPSSARAIVKAEGNVSADRLDPFNPSRDSAKNSAPANEPEAGDASKSFAFSSEKLSVPSKPAEAGTKTLADAGNAAVRRDMLTAGARRIAADEKAVTLQPQSRPAADRDTEGLLSLRQEAGPAPALTPAPTRSLQAASSLRSVPAPVVPMPTPGVALKAPATPPPAPRPARNPSAESAREALASTVITEVRADPAPAGAAGGAGGFGGAGPLELESLRFRREPGEVTVNPVPLETAPRYFRANADTRERKDDKTTTGQNILDSFDFDQNGDSIRIRDADGSIYEGKTVADVQRATFATGLGDDNNVRQPVQAGSERDLKRLEELPKAKADTSSSRGLHFRVSGTNRNLKQLVVLDGVMDSVGRGPGTARNDGRNDNLGFTDATMTSARFGKEPAASARGSLALNPNAAAAAPQKPADPTPVPLSRIRARARIGDATNEVEINAIRVTR